MYTENPECISKYVNSVSHIFQIYDLLAKPLPQDICPANQYSNRKKLNL